MIPVSDAIREVQGRARQLPAERVPLAAALGRVLREDARADLDSPPFDASAMDGYALNLGGARPPNGLGNTAQSKTRPEAGFHTIAFRLIGNSQAGAAFAGTVGPGECVRIFTGASVPTGADCVVNQEDTVREGDNVRITNIPREGSFIRRRGENCRAGDIVVAVGARLGPPELSALASVGVAQPLVTHCPRVAHVVTGNELVAPDRTPTGAQIRDSNSTLIAALLRRHGAGLSGQNRIGDDPATARTAVDVLPAHDVLLISGGASVGDRDIARPLLEALGYTLHFHAVNLRPGKPLMFASRGAQLAFALPGNPVSHWVVFHLFVAPLLRRLETGEAAPLPRLTGRLAAAGCLPPPDARHTCWPCRAEIVNGSYELTPLPLASSGDSSGLVGANALLPVPPPPASLALGQTLEFIPCP